jgi:type II secretory pathway pseudopilin PulG
MVRGTNLGLAGFSGQSKQLRQDKRRLVAGFGIVEILVAVAVIGIILTAVAAGLAMSLKTTAELKFRDVALAKGQQVIEVFRRERGINGWPTFFDLFGAGTTGTYIYCFNDDSTLLHASFPPAEGACTNTVAWDGNDYIREAAVTTTPDQVEMIVTVYWQGRDKQMVLKQILNRYQ